MLDDASLVFASPLDWKGQILELALVLGTGTTIAHEIVHSLVCLLYTLLLKNLPVSPVFGGGRFTFERPSSCVAIYPPPCKACRHVARRPTHEATVAR